MEQFVVSARKYRPATFDTVVGQANITDTLKNAIRNQHLAQAFLFTGSRGVGKTTVARILAKTINCMNRSEAMEPCDNCSSCNSFNEGHSLNIYELDAASNNSVEDIRTLIEQVRMAPQIGSHKVYIIDEVHMLSSNAFNAFLKTLEEPPAHAIFILATTEKHKIIPTILSRCQIFDFVRIRIPDMVNHLSSIAKKEGIKAEDEALHIIAEKADGALRDALSIFDQQVSFSGKELTYLNVIENLNILDYDYYFKVTDALLASDIPGSLLLFNQILSNGFEGHHFINGLAGHFRNLMVCKSPETIVLLEVSENVQKKYRSQAEKTDQLFLFQAIDILTKTDYQYKSSQNKRLLVELSLMQMASLSIEGIEKKKVHNYGIMPMITAYKKAVISKTKADTAPSIVIKEDKKEKIIEVKAAPPKAEAPPKVATPLSKGKFRSPYSLENILKEESTKSGFETELLGGDDMPKTPFGQDQLDRFWKLYVQNHVDENNRSLFTTLNQRSPELKSHFKLIFPIENKVQLNQIDQIKVDLVNYLRKHLNNYSLSFETPIKKLSSKKHIYTDEEKYKAMVEKYPILEKLREGLDLDLDQ